MGNTASKGNPTGDRPAGDKSVRVVALAGPAGTGKTSLAEAILFASGAITRRGTVENGSTVGDASPEARARGGSTEINLMRFDYLGDDFALIDTPGGAGFAADGLAALRCADLALIVIDPIPERAMLAAPMLRQLDELGVPHAVFVNKIENARAGAVRELIAGLQPMSEEPLALRQIPIREGESVTGYVDLALERAYRYRPGHESERMEIPGQLLERERRDRARLLETLADFDDALLEALLMDETPETAAVMADLAADTGANNVVPVLLGSALSGGGIHRLLKLLRHETPASDAVAERLGVKGGAFHVFKISHGGNAGRLALGRVLGTPLREGDELAADGEALRASSLFSVQGERTTRRSAADRGDVTAIAKLDAARCGMTLPMNGSPVSAADPVSYPARNARNRGNDSRSQG